MKYISLNRPYSYNNFIRDATVLSIAYPDFLKVESVGNTASNRTIIMLKAGKGPRGILLTAGVHGRESINTIALMAMLEEYAYALANRGEEELLKKKWNINLKTFFEEFTLYTIPLVNPDGYMIALRGFNMIHNLEQQRDAINMGVPYQEWKYNLCGVDINRDFPSKTWQPKHTEDMAGSQSETRILMRLMLELPTDAYIDYHSRGNEIYYHRSQMSDAYNNRQLQIARTLSLVTGYKLIKPEREIDAGDSGGNTVHFYSEQTGKPAFTIETVPEYEGFPLPRLYQRIVYNQLLFSPFVVVEL